MSQSLDHGIGSGEIADIESSYDDRTSNTAAPDDYKNVNTTQALHGNAFSGILDHGIMIRVPAAYLGFPKFRENPEIGDLMSPRMRLDSLSKGLGMNV